MLLIVTFSVQIPDLVKNQPADQPYSTPKARLIAPFQNSEILRLRMLLSNTKWGDKKPSQLLYEMKDLVVGKIALLKILCDWVDCQFLFSKYYRLARITSEV